MRATRAIRKTRRPKPQTGGRLLALGAFALVLAACTGTTAPATETSSAPPTATASSPSGSATDCVVSDRGVPSCGVLWGLSTRPPTVEGVQRVEDLLGRPFDFVYRYHDVNDTVPDAAERAQIAAGRMLHVSIATRDFADSGSAMTWKDIAAGTYDESLGAQARGIASLGVPVFVTFEQEANQKAKIARFGAPADYVAAWRHVHDLYAKAGATNAVWVWVMTGAADNLPSAAQMWPGNDQVDWISWNVYNQSGCPTGNVDPAKHVSFEEKMRIFYDWVNQQGPGLGIDVTKPMMISETGSAKYPGDLGKTAEWYAAIPGTLAKYPQLKAVGIWNSVDGTCDYRIDSEPVITEAVRAAGQQWPVSAQPTLPTPPAATSRP